MIKEAERYLDYARVDWEYRKWAKSDGEENKKYFRVKINRIPPYYPINAAYDFEEDVWAYSDKGAENKVKGQPDSLDLLSIRFNLVKNSHKTLNVYWQL